MSRHAWRRLLLIFFAGLGAAAWAAGNLQAVDPLDDIRRREKIAAEVLEADIKAALEEAKKLEAADPAKAARTLKYLLVRLESDTVLPVERRKTHEKILTERIKALEVLATRSPVDAGKKPDPVKPPPRDDLERELRQIRILREIGEHVEAARLADDLSRRHPDNAAVEAARRVTANALQLRDQARFIDEKSWKTALALREVDRSAVPIVGDIEYPKDWAEKSERRLKKYRDSMLNLTKKEAEILNILGSPTTKPLDFKGIPFEGMLDYFADEFKLPLIIDRNALKDLNIDYETTKIFARMPKGVTVRTALRAALADAGLTYLIKNEALYITTPDRAQSELVTRIYPIDDLIGPGSPFLLTNPFAQQFRQLDEEARAQKLIDLIQGLVEPGSWKPNGPGTIVYDPVRRVLVIKNTAEVINALGGGMKQ
jgi:hypothetical protein